MLIMFRISIFHAVLVYGTTDMLVVNQSVEHEVRSDCTSVAHNKSDTVRDL